MKGLSSVALGVAIAFGFAHGTFAGVMSIPTIQPAPMYQTVADMQMKVWSHNSVHLREKPTTKSKILAKLKPGTTVTVVEKVRGGLWAHVTVNGMEGYIDSRLIE